MTDAQVSVAARGDPDNLPLTRGDVAKLATAKLVRDARRAASLTQAEFARTYHFTPGRLRDLEQGRTKVDSAMKAYLTLIRNEPDLIRRKLVGTRKPG